MTPLDELRAELRAFVAARDWQQFHDPIPRRYSGVRIGRQVGLVTPRRAQASPVVTFS
jgi:hypothetical protein